MPSVPPRAPSCRTGPLHSPPRFDPWQAAALLIAVILLLPFAAILWIAATPAENVWPHLARTALPRYLGNTVLLMALVAAGTAAVGTGAAWLITTYRFPGRRLLSWALLAPLTVPSFIAAYAFVELLDYAGPVQTLIRDVFGFRNAQEYRFPDIRSMGGAAITMTFAFYPYVYLLARAAFQEQSSLTFEASRSLGSSAGQSLWRVSLPLARPAIVAGTALALMETLADFGTVEFFAVQSLTVGIFAIWLEGYNAGGAAQLALVALSLVVLLLALERINRRSARFHDPTSLFRPGSGRTLHGVGGWLACLACTLPVLIGFVTPVCVLADLALPRADRFLSSAFLLAGLRTLTVAAFAASLTVVLMLTLAFGVRNARSPLARHAARLATLGYAVPGAVLAVGILFPLLAVDKFLHSLQLTSGLLVGGSVFGLIAAYVVRFAAVPYGAIDAGFARVTPAMETAARTLGATRPRVLRRIQMPLLGGSLVTGGLLMFVETVKELPATLILRPFGYDSLATLAYTHASLEQIGEAAPAALAVIATGLLPALLFRKAFWRMSWTQRVRSGRTAE